MLHLRYSLSVDFFLGSFSRSSYLLLWWIIGSYGCFGLDNGMIYHIHTFDILYVWFDWHLGKENEVVYFVKANKRPFTYYRSSATKVMLVLPLMCGHVESYFMFWWLATFLLMKLISQLCTERLADYLLFTMTFFIYPLNLHFWIIFQRAHWILLHI